MKQTMLMEVSGAQSALQILAAWVVSMVRLTANHERRAEYRQNCVATGRSGARGRPHGADDGPGAHGDRIGDHRRGHEADHERAPVQVVGRGAGRDGSTGATSILPARRPGCGGTRPGVSVGPLLVPPPPPGFEPPPTRLSPPHATPTSHP